MRTFVSAVITIYKLPRTMEGSLSLSPLNPALSVVRASDSLG